MKNIELTEKSGLVADFVLCGFPRSSLNSQNSVEMAGLIVLFLMKGKSIEVNP